jgi:hypothetical protein
MRLPGSRVARHEDAEACDGRVGANVLYDGVLGDAVIAREVDHGAKRGKAEESEGPTRGETKDRRSEDHLGRFCRACYDGVGGEDVKDGKDWVYEAPLLVADDRVDADGPRSELGKELRIRAVVARQVPVDANDGPRNGSGE